MTERRKAPRGRVLKSGQIVFNNRFSVMDCTVRNLSTDGALLLVGDIVAVPNSFTLVMEPDKAEKECEVIWRREGKLGVRFL